MKNKTVLTAKAVDALKPRPTGRYFVQDVAVPGLLVCVTPTGHKSFLLGARYPGSRHFKRRELGQVGVITLSDARQLAREWLVLIKAGSDPRQVRRAATDSFAAVAENFITVKLSSQRQGKRVAHRLRVEVLPYWGDRLIAGITRRDVRELIQHKHKGTGAYARNIYDAVRAVFRYALNEDIIEHSPVEALKPADLIGEKKIRERVLDDDEIACLWRACEQLGYPFGPLTQLLLLTGARLTELSRAVWDEIDLERRTLTVPAARFKMNSQHVIHLSDTAVRILAALPRWAAGNFVFSFQDGRAPVSGFGHAKERLDAIMGFDDWVIHDLRRVVRSRLAELRVPEHVAEMVIGHSRRGLQRVYDQYRYGTEIAEALQAWARHLRTIIDPTARDNVVQLQREAT